MIRKKRLLGMICMSAAILLVACGTADENESSAPKEEEEMDMKHSDSGEVPDDLKEATDPTYKVGSTAMIETDHMEGMKGAEAMIVGAYDTTAYVISYTPTDGGKKVENHKWVIQEEIENAGEETLNQGKEVIIEADHMEGMKGATAEIESSEKTTVYMVDYMPTTGGKEVKNHKWVTEEELSAE